MDTRRKIEVLCVDDNAMILMLLAKILETIEGVTATTLENPEEALVVFKENPDRFALLLTDFMMPQMSGGEFALRVRLLKKTQPIVAVSSAPKACKPAWAFDDVISKPFTAEIIEGVVARFRGCHST